MKTCKFPTLVMAAMLTIMVGLLLPGSAQAQSNPYAVLCITNNADARITYSYRWGTSGSWKSSTLDSGEWDTHSWLFDQGSTRSPMFEIKFDADITSDNLPRYYELSRYQAPLKSCVWGKNYAFEHENWWKIDLYTQD